MVIGLGTDIVSMSRIKTVHEKQGDRFVARLLTDAEQAIYRSRKTPIAFLATRFAGKEAVSKALGTGIAKGLRFTDIEIIPNPLGQPHVNLSGEAKHRLEALGGSQVLISLSDEKDYAVAFVTIA